MPYVFDMLKSSMPTSRAPSAARKLAGARPSKTRSPYAKSCRIHVRVRSAHATASAKNPSGTADAVGFDGKLRYSAAAPGPSKPSNDAARAPASATAEK